MTTIQQFAMEHECGGGAHICHPDGSVTIRVGLAKDGKIVEVEETVCRTMQEVRDALGY